MFNNFFFNYIYGKKKGGNTNFKNNEIKLNNNTSGNNINSKMSSVVIGFMNLDTCPYCIEFRKTWEQIKSKNKNVVFIEMNKDTLTDDISIFNNNKNYRNVLGNNAININDIETFPTIFYIENNKIKYYGRDDNNTDRNEKTIQLLIDKLSKKIKYNITNKRNKIHINKYKYTKNNNNKSRKFNKTNKQRIV